MILYTHLGKMGKYPGFSKQSTDALRRLAERYSRGEILVSTTARLLDYTQMLNTIDWTVEKAAGADIISVSTDRRYSCVDGLTFNVASGHDYKLKVNGHFVRTDIDSLSSMGRRAFGLAWKKLAYSL